MSHNGSLEEKIQLVSPIHYPQNLCKLLVITLGQYVTITNNFFWQPHITKEQEYKSECCTETLNLQLKHKVYSTTIRPHLEYASPVWSPFHERN